MWLISSPKGVTLPKGQLATPFLPPFNQASKPCKLSAVQQSRSVLLAETEDMPIESFLKVLQQANEGRPVRQYLKELCRTGKELGEKTVLEYSPSLKIGDQNRENKQFASKGFRQNAFFFEVRMKES